MLSTIQTENIHNIISNYQTANYQKINVYGIVTFICTRRNKCTNLTIVDETCTEEEKLKCIVFERSVPLDANCELGDVVRLNRIKIQSFKGQPQGVCNNTFSSWVCFKRNNPQSFSGQSNNVSDEDMDRVKSLLNWLNTKPRNQALYEASLSASMPREPSEVTENDLEMAASVMNMQHLDQSAPETTKVKLTTFSGLQKDSYVNIVCQVCAICDNKGVRFLLVWDGTKSDFVIHQEHEFTIMDQNKNKIFFSNRITEFIFPVYVFDEFVQQLNKLEPGDYVVLKNARVCPPPNNSDADLLIKMPGIQNSNQSKYGRSITKLDPSITTHNQEIIQIIENIDKKCKEFEMKFVSEEEFRAEIRAELFNDTFGHLLDKNAPKSNGDKVQTILSQVNELMNEDTQMYYSEEETEPREQQVMTENQNLLNQEEAMVEDQVQTSIKIDPLAISQDIYTLKKLANLTYICPFLSAPSLGISTQMFEHQYPFYTSIKNLIEDSATKPYLKCKLVAKLYNYSAISSPHISMVFVKCNKCNYINFTPIHLAGAYQPAHLNNLLSIPEVKCSSQIPGTLHQNASFEPFHNAENCQPSETKSQNFSLEWLQTATPSYFDPIINTQEQSSECMVNYGYVCPRCSLNEENANSQDHQVLDYVYRLWLVLRDAEAKLDPCLIEEDVALQFLNGIEPIKFYTNQVKGHQVYKIIHKNFNKKFLFTLEMFNLKLIKNQHGNEIGDQVKRMDCVYKVVKLEELVSD